MSDTSVDDDYDSIFAELKAKWLLTEQEHTASKTASDMFWKLSMEYFPRLEAAHGKRKNTPQFNSIRRKMYLDVLPPIQIEIGFKNKATGDIVVVNDTITPLKRFPNSNYEKLYEIGTVKVSSIITNYIIYVSPNRCSGLFK